MQPEWAAIISVVMAFLMLGWLGFIVVIWVISVIGLIHEGVRFFLGPWRHPAAWWEHSETTTPSGEEGPGGRIRDG